ncbi:MAG: serine hydrolase domain-containing protein [Planctomycetia bacterium]|nr:serine hydrolase domain-containing protein [Planctomycetia bacterium]
MKGRIQFFIVATTIFLSSIAFSYFSCAAELGTESTQISAQSTSHPAVRDALQPFVDRGEMAGFVSVVANKDRVLQLDCVGFANVETQTPMAPDTLFWIASTTKIFTSAAIMTLVDEEKINLDDPIEKYLPQFRGCKVFVSNAEGVLTLRDPKTKPTVRQALCHTAGWSFKTPMMDHFGIDSLPPDKAALYFASVPMVSDPGEKYQYSQVGIDLAGAIVEKVSGMPFHEYLQTKFFTPLGMKDTTFWPDAEAQRKLATSYRWNREANRLAEMKLEMFSYPLDDRTRRFAEPGGGLFSTPQDLVKFFQMLAGKGVYDGTRYLSESAVEQIATKQTPPNISHAYGLCAFLYGAWFGHGGAYGNEAAANTQTGEVMIYMVQVGGVPKQGEAKNAWRQAAEKVLKERAIHE